MAKLWKEAELQIIREFYPSLGPRGCAPLLQGRAPKTICDKARKMRVRMNADAMSQVRIAQANSASKPGEYKKPAPPAFLREMPEEYLQAADIFQVGYRVARNLGVIGDFVGSSA